MSSNNWIWHPSMRQKGYTIDFLIWNWSFHKASFLGIFELLFMKERNHFNLNLRIKAMTKHFLNHVMIHKKEAISMGIVLWKYVFMINGILFNDINKYLIHLLNRGQNMAYLISSLRFQWLLKGRHYEKKKITKCKN